MRTLAAAALLALMSCGPQATGTAGATRPAPSARPAQDTTSSLIPPGLGTLKEADISIALQPTGVRVTTFPLDESVIRTLAPDSYRAMHANVESRGQVIRQRAAAHGERQPSVWFVRFYGLAPDARFDPMDLTLSVGGRDFRPFDVVPLSGDLGTHRLQPRETQTALLLFDGAVDVTQPIVVRMGAEQNSDWNIGLGMILGKIDAERAAIRARASAKTQPSSSHPAR